AYADLPAELHELADRLCAVHSKDDDYARDNRIAAVEQLETYRKGLTSTVYNTGYPVGRLEPQRCMTRLRLEIVLKRVEVQL
ncbi:TauD/TfdA family dioxygenase, partial [Pseudomonas aeruginosa]